MPCDWFIKDRAISTEQKCCLSTESYSHMLAELSGCHVFFWCLSFMAIMSRVSYKSFTCKEIMNVEFMIMPFGKMLARRLDKDYPDLSMN